MNNNTVRHVLALDHTARAWSLQEAGFSNDQWPDEQGMTPRQAAIMHLRAAADALDQVAQDKRLSMNFKSRVRRHKQGKTPNAAQL